MESHVGLKIGFFFVNLLFSRLGEQPRKSAGAWRCTVRLPGGLILGVSKTLELALLAQHI